MPLRKLLLRVLLWSLAIAAVLGATMIIVGPEEAIWRVIGTSLVTSGASAVMLACSLLVDREHGRSAGLLGISATVLEYLLAVLLIWIADAYVGWRFEERLGMTLFFLPCCVIPAMASLTVIHHPLARVSARTGLAVSAAAFALLMLGTWMEQSWSARWDFFEVALVLAGFGISAIAAMVGAGTDRQHWRWIGVAASIAGFLIATYALVFEIRSDSPVMTYIIAAAAVVAHVNLAMQTPLSGVQIWVRHATITFTIATGALAAIVIGHDLLENDLLARIAGACGLIAGCGSLALLIFARLNRRMGARPVLAAVSRITVICPGCDRKQTLDTGEAQCPHCRLIIFTRIEEPRCANCDYSLFMLESDRCPECGARVDAEAAAHAGASA